MCFPSLACSGSCRASVIIHLLLHYIIQLHKRRKDVSRVHWVAEESCGKTGEKNFTRVEPRSTNWRRSWRNLAVWLCKLLPQISVQYSRSYTAHLRGLCIIRLQSNRQNKYFIQVSVQPYMEVEPIVKNAKHVSWVYISQLKSFINHQQWMSSETDVA